MLEHQWDSWYVEPWCVEYSYSWYQRQRLLSGYVYATNYCLLFEVCHVTRAQSYGMSVVGTYDVDAVHAGPGTCCCVCEGLLLLHVCWYWFYQLLWLLGEVVLKVRDPCAM